MNKISSEDFAEVFELGCEETPHRSRCEPITIWLPVESKEKYDLLQARSKRKFGKFLKEVVEKSIDKVRINQKAA